MKIGPKTLEGTPEEIQNFFWISDSNIDEFLEKPTPPIKGIWFSIPIIVIFVSIFLLVFFVTNSTGLQLFLFIVGCGAGLAFAIMIQLKYKNSWASGITLFGCALLMLVALGIMAPSELAQQFKDLVGSESKPK